MGEPMPSWMREYMKLSREVDALRFKKDRRSQLKLSQKLSKIRTIVKKYS